MSLNFNPNTNEDKNINFLVFIHSLSYNFHLLKQNVNAVLQGKTKWLKLANVNVSESMLTYKPKYWTDRILYSGGKNTQSPKLSKMSKIVSKFCGTRFSHCS